MAIGRAWEAVGRVEQGLELDPLNSVINASVGMIRYFGSRLRWGAASPAARARNRPHPLRVISAHGARVLAEELAQRSDRRDAAGGDAFQGGRAGFSRG